jgi:hypothetical protein
MQAKPFAKFIKPFWKILFYFGKLVSYCFKTLCWFLENFRNWFELIWCLFARDINKTKKEKEKIEKKGERGGGAISAQWPKPAKPAYLSEPKRYTAP